MRLDDAGRVRLLPRILGLLRLTTHQDGLAALEDHPVCLAVAWGVGDPIFRLRLRLADRGHDLLAHHALALAVFVQVRRGPKGREHRVRRERLGDALGSGVAAQVLPEQRLGAPRGHDARELHAHVRHLRELHEHLGDEPFALRPGCERLTEDALKDVLRNLLLQCFTDRATGARQRHMRCHCTTSSGSARKWVEN